MSFNNRLQTTHYKLRTRSGFTLIETMIYIAIIGGAVSSFVLFATTVSNVRSKIYVQQEVNANARVALDVIADRIRSASGVNAGNSTFGSDPGVLELSMDAAAANPTIINLSANDGILQIKEGASSVVALTSDEVRVSNLVFTDLTPASGNQRENIRIDLTIEYNVPSGDANFGYTNSVQTSVSVRE
jgi:type II secretory pathway pseudopilin PulG